jgi:DNA-binding SARP family transcriptional activator
MRATICIDLDNQAMLPRLIETIAKHVTLHSIQIDQAPYVPHEGIRQLTARMLGPMQCSINGQVVSLGRVKAYELLALLMMQGGVADREVLSDALWPESPPRQALGSLNTTITFLRKQLGSESIVYQAPRYAFNDQALAWSNDLGTFLQLAEQGSEAALVQAQKLYIGPLLEGVDAPWLEQHRLRIEQRYTAMVYTLAGYAEERQEYLRAKEWFQLLAGRDPLDERACIGLMRCCLATNHRAEAISHFHRLRVALDEELGLELEPDSEAQVLYRRLLGV